jgi:hypothetical protein
MSSIDYDFIGDSGNRQKVLDSDTGFLFEDITSIHSFSFCIVSTFYYWMLG